MFVIQILVRHDPSNGGLVATDPLLSVGSCDFTRAQFNPLHNTLDVSNPSDTRYQKPEVGVTDAVHVLRATTGNARFIQPHAKCEPSWDVAGHRPDLLIRSSVLAIDPRRRGRPSGVLRNVYFFCAASPKNLVICL